MKQLISKLYSKIVDKKNNDFENGEVETFKAKAIVISIGNLSTGGTGKTPLTESITKYLLSQNKKVAIAAKGYKGNFKNDLLVRDEKRIYSTVDECGDEMYMLAQNISVPIAVNNEKYKAVKYLDSNYALDYIIVDDGFQHRKLFRDLDIVILDKNSLDHPFVLPMGMLREPIKNIQRADFICIYEELINDDKFLKLKEDLNINDDKIITLKTNIIGIFNEKKEAIEINQAVILLSGLGNNSKFHNSCKDFNIKIRGTMEFKDHHTYIMKDIKRIIDIAQRDLIFNIITTEKDIVKLEIFRNNFKKYGIKLHYLRIESEITNNKHILFDKLLNIQNDRIN